MFPFKFSRLHGLVKLPRDCWCNGILCIQKISRFSLQTAVPMRSARLLLSLIRFAFCSSLSDHNVDAILLQFKINPLLFARLAHL